MAIDRAQYILSLNHFEFNGTATVATPKGGITLPVIARDNQIEVIRKDGDILSSLDLRSIKQSANEACHIIFGDLNRR